MKEVNESALDAKRSGQQAPASKVAILGFVNDRPVTQTQEIKPDFRNSTSNFTIFEGLRAPSV